MRHTPKAVRVMAHAFQRAAAQSVNAIRAGMVKIVRVLHNTHVLDTERVLTTLRVSALTTPAAIRTYTLTAHTVNNVKRIGSAARVICTVSLRKNTIPMPIRMECPLAVMDTVRVSWILH